jgi:hypothetical protein
MEHLQLIAATHFCLPGISLAAILESVKRDIS